MKKIIALILCLFVAVSLSAIAFATTTATMTVSASKATAVRGDEIVFTVSLSEVENLRSAGFSMSFEESVFTFVEGSAKCLVEGAENVELLKYNTNAGAYVAFFGLDNKTFSGAMFQFTLKVREDAPENRGGIVAVGTPKVNKGDVTCTVENIEVKISCTHEYGTWNRLNDDQHGKSCTKCGDVVKEDHTWDAGKTEIEATCSKGGLTIHTCTKCNATKEITTEKLPHVYDNACDTECNNGCGTTRAPDHDYRHEWSSDDTNHWHQCNVCGDQSDVQPHEPGAPATEWSAQKCKVCDHVLQPALGHTHNYETQWTKDDRGHWHTCKGCEELKDYADHVYDNSCDTDCNTCGYVRTIEHTMDSNWWFDADGHWHECTVCGEKSHIEPHVPGPEATETSAQNCVDCGYELAPMVGHTHDYGYDWYFDEAGHWQQCSCGGNSVREAHAWNEGMVTRQPTSEMDGEMYYICTVCDAEKREPIKWQGGQAPTEPTRPSAGEPDPQPKEFPWWVLVVAGGVLVLGFVVFMIVGAILGQRKTGKFSEK
jgi:hypothetical protein